MIKKNSGVFNIKTHARLHLGFFDLHGGLGRKFGSLGLSLENPVTEIEACLSDVLKIEGAIGIKSRESITKIIQNMQNEFNLQTSCNFKFSRFIPSHVGFGSGTQMALSVVALISKLYGLNLEQRQIAHFSGRGARSGVGLGTFFQGGLVVDAGRGEKTTIPPVIARLDFPEDWRILLIYDKNQIGINGQTEHQAFSTLPEFPSSLAGELCRHVLMQGLPAIYEQDLDSFGSTVRALQVATGEHFSGAQGGLYASKNVEEVLNFLEKNAVKCLGQSSWGPTGFAILENETIANDHLTKLKSRFKDNINLSFSITQGYNKGASIQLV
jgi:beta-ribofuranosylaminobenzene 5'-phosphate synthase